MIAFIESLYNEYANDLFREFFFYWKTGVVFNTTENVEFELKESVESMESVYTFIFWNIDWIFSYITTNAVIGFKFVISNFFTLLHNSGFGYFFEYIWYKHIQNSSVELFVNSVMFDLISFGKSVELPFTVSIDVCPILGWYSPYMLEHPELFAYMDRYENNYYFSKFGEYAISFFNSNYYLVLATSMQLASNLFGVLYVWLVLKIFFFSFFFFSFKWFAISWRWSFC